MKRPILVVALGLALVVADRIARGWEEHVSFVSGMAGTSWVIGSIVIVLRILAALAPILLLAGAADAFFAWRACKLERG